MQFAVQAFDNLPAVKDADVQNGCVFTSRQSLHLLRVKEGSWVNLSWQHFLERKLRIFISDRVDDNQHGQGRQGEQETVRYVLMSPQLFFNLTRKYDQFVNASEVKVEVRIDENSGSLLF